MLPWPKIATESPMPMPAVSTAATLSLSDCRQAASLSEIRSSTRTRAISGRSARSAKQPGSWKPMIGPLRQRWSLPSRQNGQAPQGSFARAATRSPGRTRVTPSPTSTTRAQNSWPKSCTGASVSSRRLIALVGERRDAEGELGLGDAGLDAERLGDHMARPADRLRHVVEPHVAEP